MKRLSLIVLYAVLALQTVMCTSTYIHLDWRLDNLTSLLPYFLALSFVVVAVAWVLKNKLAFGLAILISVGYGINYLPYFQVETSKASDHIIKLLTHNVYVGNTKYEKTQTMLLKSSPDIIFLGEFTKAWIPALKELKRKYPYHIERPSTTPFGCALYSSFPIKSYRIHHLASYGHPSIVANVDVHGKIYHVIGTHLYPPFSGYMINIRNLQLLDLEKLISESEEPVILLGDLNLSPFSPLFKNFIKGIDLLPTYPYSSYASTYHVTRHKLGVIIDHIIVPKSFAITDFNLLDPSGSDHIPLLVTAALAP